MALRKRGGLAAALALTLFPSLTLADAPAASDPTQEDAFLDVLPKLEVPAEVTPIPGAVNEEFRNCRATWPAGYELAQSGPEARPLRDIYGFIQARNVVVSKDCGCSGKVASWDDVEMLADVLREAENVDRLTWQDTKEIADEADRLTVVAETMCGGSF